MVSRACCTCDTVRCRSQTFSVLLSWASSNDVARHVLVYAAHGLRVQAMQELSLRSTLPRVFMFVSMALRSWSRRQKKWFGDNKMQRRNSSSRVRYLCPGLNADPFAALVKVLISVRSRGQWARLFTTQPVYNCTHVVGNELFGFSIQAFFCAKRIRSVTSDTHVAFFLRNWQVYGNQ